jgi:L,D-peptidoglycan transpeptidase YkuD (ErfK/YbiS/YcfS/YnhG family)
MLIDVSPTGPGSARGWCRWRGNRVPCALGRGGIRAVKFEGDGATPAGTWPLRHVLYRADRLFPGRFPLPSRAVRRGDGWSDGPRDPRYNRPVPLPHAFGHERLWRADELYDLILVLGYNDDPPVAGRGSAIFLHRARDDYSPTEGCVALGLEDLLHLVADLAARTFVRIREV